jgi:hypothetical protein
MAMAALSPSSVLASPIQVNPQVKTDLQVSVPQVAEEARRAAKATQTDTITISAQALKMADDRNVVAKESADRLDEQKTLQRANNKTDAAKDLTRENAVKAYAAVSANQ